MNAAQGERVLGRYRILRRLAQGGMGVVYLGRLEGAAGFSKPVIIKRVLSEVENPKENEARFIREAQILSHLQHPNIVGVLDFGRDGNGYAMVLEYMHGYDLGRWLKYLHLSSQLLAWEEALQIALRALHGLHYAHTFQRSDGTSAGVLHRDISPGNILIDLDGQVRLLDFGIARMDQADVAQYKTQDDVLQGKVSFLAPELFAKAATSPSSDTYSLAVVLYQMLAGVHPFRADNDSQTMWRVLSEDPESLASYRTDLPAGLEPALFRALAKEPEQRYESAEHFARALRAHLTRNEADIESDLLARVRRDFAGEMPALLGVEPLSERDHAWRSAGDPDAPAAALRSSHFPPAQSLTRIELRPTAAALPGSAQAPETATASWEQAKHPTATADRRWRVPLALAAAGVLAGAGWLLGQRPAAGGGRFIVVDGKGAPASAAAAPAATPGADNAGPSAQLQAAADPPAAGLDRVGDGPDSDRAALARQLARRQTELQACVRQHAADLSQQVELTLSFDVAASGRVAAASLQPAQLEATGAGRCLLQVARETEFQPLTQPLHFSVPLRARAAAKRR